MEKYLIVFLYSAVGAVVCVLCCKKMLQSLQLSGYRARGITTALRKNSLDYLARYFGLSFFPLCCAFILAMSFPHNIVRHVGMVFLLFFAIVFVVVEGKQAKKQKTPLVFTPRITRLITAIGVLSMVIGFALVNFTIDNVVGGLLINLLPILIPVIVIAANFCMRPIEALIAARYIRKAKKRLKCGKTTIGITGSYGKTTAKNILAAFLAAKYRVMSSPNSYNTPMGLCKLINNGITEGENLRQIEEFDILIAEMGARRKGEIATLCDIVVPDYGIITVTGSQHLETFKTVETIVATKLELACAAKKLTVLNADDSALVSAAANLKKDGKICGELLNAGGDLSSADASYSDVTISADGTTFNLQLGGQKVKITTALLGRHIPQLIAECALLAFKLGVSVADIAAAAATLQSVPHRLQLIKTATGVVIDDAYNSNPAGAQNALEVLAAIDGERVVITPGFVELGKIGDDENYKLGQAIVQNAQYCIAVGNKKIYEGAAELGQNALLVSSLSEATKKLTELKLSRPIVLFLNDLPDNY